MTENIATRLIVDLDETITLGADAGYEHAVPNVPLIAKLRDYKAQGFEIVISTSRNMRTFAGNVGKINAHTLPIILTWLHKHDVPFDEVYVGKPWCGHGGFYVDDKAVRPSEFVRYTALELRTLLAAEKAER